MWLLSKTKLSQRVSIILYMSPSLRGGSCCEHLVSDDVRCRESGNFIANTNVSYPVSSFGNDSIFLLSGSKTKSPTRTLLDFTGFFLRARKVSPGNEEGRLLLTPVWNRL